MCPVCIVLSSHPPLPPSLPVPIQAKGASAGEAFQSEVVDRAVAWKEWYGLRLIDEFRQTDDTAAFSRSAEALTDFLASLPPTKQVRRRLAEGLQRCREGSRGVGSFKNNGHRS